MLHPSFSCVDLHAPSFHSLRWFSWSWLVDRSGFLPKQQCRPRILGLLRLWNCLNFFFFNRDYNFCLVRLIFWNLPEKYGYGHIHQWHIYSVDIYIIYIYMAWTILGHIHQSHLWCRYNIIMHQLHNMHTMMSFHLVISYSWNIIKPSNHLFQLSYD